MSISLINKVKYSPLFLKLYSSIGGVCVRFFQKLIRVDPNMMIFVCFGGRQYGDSPKRIYEQMLGDERFEDIKYVWAFIDPSKHNIKKGKKIKIDSVQYYYYLFKSNAWITNSGVERGLSFKPQGRFYLDTWHGSALKCGGVDTPEESEVFGMMQEGTEETWCAQSEFDLKHLSHAFCVPEKNFLLIGMPRNDELVSNNNPEYKKLVKEKLGISDDKKIILYAPTYREYLRDENDNCIIAPPISVSNLKKEIGDNYIFLFRCHYEVIKSMNIEEDDFCRNVSSYPNVNDLMIIADILISDYSSMYSDFSILEKPMLCFSYDYEEYSRKRGLYYDIREALESWPSNEKELINEIKSLNYDARVNIAKRFKSVHAQAYGDSTLKAVDAIYKGLISTKYYRNQSFG